VNGFTKVKGYAVKLGRRDSAEKAAYKRKEVVVVQVVMVSIQKISLTWCRCW
jgi:hypothetical protein